MAFITCLYELCLQLNMTMITICFRLSWKFLVFSWRVVFKCVQKCYRYRYCWYLYYFQDSLWSFFQGISDSKHTYVCTCTLFKKIR